MIQPESRLRVADNTGARTIQCIRDLCSNLDDPIVLKRGITDHLVQRLAFQVLHRQKRSTIVGLTHFIDNTHVGMTQ